MITENHIRVSPTMKKLLDEEVEWFKKKGVVITRVEASRIIAQRAKDIGKRKIDLADRGWEKGLGMK